MGYGCGTWFVLIGQAERFYRAPFMVFNLLGLVKMLTFKKYKMKNFLLIIMLNQMTYVLFTSHFNRSSILGNRLTSHEQRKCLYLPGPANSSSIFLPFFSVSYYHFIYCTIWTLSYVLGGVFFLIIEAKILSALHLKLMISRIEILMCDVLRRRKMQTSQVVQEVRFPAS